MRTLSFILIVIQSQSVLIKEIDVSSQNWAANITQRKTNSTHLLNVTKKSTQRFILLELFAYSEQPSTNLILLQSYNEAPYYDTSKKASKIFSDNADENGKYQAKKYHHIILDQKNVTQFSTYVTVLTNTTIQYSVFITGFKQKPCPKQCSQNGTCIKGICKCFSGYTDLDCSQEGFEITPFLGVKQIFDNINSQQKYLYATINSTESYIFKLACQSVSSEDISMTLQVRISHKGKLPCNQINDYNINLKGNDQIELRFLQNQKQSQSDELKLVLKLGFQNFTKQQSMLLNYEIQYHEFPDEDQEYRIIICVMLIVLFTIAFYLIIKYCSCQENWKVIESPQTEELCVICQDVFQQHKENRIVQLNCKHIYHENCIKMQMKVNRECPVCKIKI